MLIDGANVAWEAPKAASIIIVDAPLEHQIDDPDLLEALFSSAKAAD